MPPVREHPPVATAPSLVRRLARVERVERHTVDTVTLDVRTLHGDWGPFAPGQFDMLTGIGVGEAPISLSGDPNDRVSRHYTVRAVGAVTRALANLRPGQQLGVRGPYGRPWPVDEAADTDVLIVAGGLGLAPLRPAILHLLTHRERYRRIGILYGARTPADLLFVEHLARHGVTVIASTYRWNARWPAAWACAGTASSGRCSSAPTARCCATTAWRRGWPPGRCEAWPTRRSWRCGSSPRATAASCRCSAPPTSS